MRIYLNANIENESTFSNDYWGFLFPGCANILKIKKILAKESFGMSQPAAALSFTNMMNPHLFFFFFALSPFLFFSSRVLHCRKPVRLFACQQGNYHHYNFHLCLRRIVLNKTHNREIPLRNSRMRIILDASMKKSQVESFLSVCQSISGAATITNRESILCILIA